MRPLSPARFRRVSSVATVVATLLAGTGFYLIFGLYLVFDEFRSGPVAWGIVLAVLGILLMAGVGRLRIEGQAEPSDRPNVTKRRSEGAAEEWEPR